MLKFPLPILPKLQPLTDALTTHNVDVYLSGYLCDSRLLFIDIAWETAEKLQSQLPQGWTFIYAYFVSSEAVAHGESDPLLGGVDIASVLENYCPKGLSRAEADASRESLIQQAEYLLQFPPSRLVYLQGNEIPKQDIETMIQVIRG